ncbi:MAG TPA: WXG100 family type VII secretion target [Actinomycetes bacterium]|jgi:WXG100 family type VII secretion target
MPAGLIKVSPEQLAGVAGQLRSGATSIESTLGQLSGNVAPLGADWAGVAQVRFQELWDQWQTSSRQLQQALAEIAGLMQGASADYEANERAVASRFGR